MAKRKLKVTPSQILSKYELDEVDQAILRHKVQHPAMPHQDIASILGVHRRVVARRMEKEPWKKAFSDYFMPAKEVIESNVQRLAKRYVSLAYSKDEKVSERVIRTILLSAGIHKQEAATIENFEPLIIAFENETKELRTVMEATKTIDAAPKVEITSGS